MAVGHIYADPNLDQAQEFFEAVDHLIKAIWTDSVLITASTKDKKSKIRSGEQRGFRPCRQLPRNSGSSFRRRYRIKVPDRRNHRLSNFCDIFLDLPLPLYQPLLATRPKERKEENSENQEAPDSPGTSVRALTMLGHRFPFLGLLLGPSCWIGCRTCMVFFWIGYTWVVWLIRVTWGARQRRLLVARRRSRDRVWRWMPYESFVPYYQ